MIRNLLWELDGALFDTSPAKTYALSKAMTELGCSVPLNWIDGLVRQSYDQCIYKLEKRVGYSFQEINSAFQRYYSAIPCSNQVLLPGAVQVCAWVLERGGFNYAFTDLDEQIGRQFLCERRISSYFSGLFQKPHCQIQPVSEWLCDLMTLKQLDPDSTLMVARHDQLIQAARQTGTKTCFFGEARNNSVADWQVTHYDQLIELLEQ